MEVILEKLVEGLKKAYGPRLRSLVLYGSRASGEETPGFSNYNILVILDDVSFEQLHVGGILSKWVRQGNPPPLVFSKELFRNSADIFPIEFLDMKDKHRILFGEDPFNGLNVDLKHLRHQCEFEMTGKLLKLRQAYMAIAGKPKETRRLMTDSLSSLQVVIRHILRLYNETPPALKKDAVRSLGRFIDFDPETFEKVQLIKQGDRDALGMDPEAMMEKYLAQVEKIAAAVDGMDH